MSRSARYGLLAGCLGLIALHARAATQAWDGGAPAFTSADTPDDSVAADASEDPVLELAAADNS